MLLLPPDPTVHATTVIGRREPAPGIVVLELHAPELASLATGGQFVLAIPPGGQLPGTALGIYSVHGEGVSFMVIVVGPRTRELSNLAVGASLDVLGPLGNGFDHDALGDNVAIVAGGVGVASVLMSARALRERGARVHLYYGARTAQSLVDLEFFEQVGCETTVATDDGSRGYHGYITGVLAGTIAAHSALIACGPSPMLRAAAAVASRHAVPAQLALEEQFACGVGACWGCVVALDRRSTQAPPFPPPVAGEGRDYVHARVCKEGPVFWAHDLRW